MKYATFSLPDDPRQRLGAVLADRVIDLAALTAGTSRRCPDSLLELILSGPAVWNDVRKIVEREAPRSAGAAGYPADGIRWHAPIPRPAKNIFCVGLNYTSHIAETAAARARPAPTVTVPVFFTKAPTTVIGPHDPIPLHRPATRELDYEIELGVIVGTGGKDITAANALDHVFGYTIVNDVSARDLQKSHSQWFKGKSLDGSCPMGPCIVTADEFGDPHSKQLTLSIDGDVRQSATTADMIFRIDQIIEWLSKGMTVEPGDIIATGTPEGVGLGRTPPLYLNDGETVEAVIDGIGALRNRIDGTG